jgi:hypothetical protein
MGRVSRYKKVKSCYKANDNGTAFGEWGFGDNGQRAKKKSLTVQRIKAREERELRARQQQKRPAKVGRGRDANAAVAAAVDHHNDHQLLFDAPPDDVQDEFDLTTFQVQKQSVVDGDQKNKTITSSSNNPPVPSATGSSGAGGTAMLSNSLEEHKLFKKFEKDLVAASATANGKKGSNKTKANLDVEGVGRREGESKSAYNRRSGRETRQMIEESQSKGKTTVAESKTKRKTKKALAEKKLKKKLGRDYVTNTKKNASVAAAVDADDVVTRRGRSRPTSDRYAS